MNADALTQLALDAHNLIAWGADVFTYGGVVIPCVAGRISNKDSMEVGGIFNNYAGAIVVERGAFTTIPKPGEYVTLSAVEYRIGSVINSAMHPTVKLNLEHGEAPTQ